MSTDPTQPEENVAVGAAFRSTHWSLIVKAGDSLSPGSSTALEELCQRYWYPLYSFSRRCGQSAHDAQDMTQGFFAKLLEKGYVKAADQNKGRFRNFLLTAFKAYSTNEWDRAQAQKRGGEVDHVSLDWEDAEERFLAEPSSSSDPEIAYDKRWALTLIDRVTEKLKGEYQRIGKRERYETLKAFMLDDPDPGAYELVASTLGLSESGVRTSVMRLRHRFSRMVRDEIADTVDTDEALQQELQHLLMALSS